jgi:hypothetical protein
MNYNVNVDNIRKDKMNIWEASVQKQKRSIMYQKKNIPASRKTENLEQDMDFIEYHKTIN